jgi:hypothetical protein
LEKKKSLKEENEKKIEKITKTEIESKKKKLCDLKEIESVGFENCVRFANSVRFEKKKKTLREKIPQKKIQETQRERNNQENRNRREEMREISCFERWRSLL